MRTDGGQLPTMRMVKLYPYRKSSFVNITLELVTTMNCMQLERRALKSHPSLLFHKMLLTKPHRYTQVCTSG